MAKVYIETYGCTLNQADTDMMIALLSGRGGHEIVPGWEEADVVILNTCTVKAATENRILERIRRLVAGKRKIVIAGCLTADRERIRKAAPCAPMVAPSALAHVAEAVDDALSCRCGASGTGTIYDGNESKGSLPRILTAPIARIPISEGCTSACFFCQTRFARPYLRSYSPKTIVRWMNEAVEGGAKEIQLTSMDSGAYGLDMKTDLVSLMELIAGHAAEAGYYSRGFRVRLGMINPDHARRMLPRLIDALKRPAFYKFLHVPVQTGSEKVCRAMNRDHTVEDFERIVATLRRELPEATIATDIIVGYPGESEEDFQDTLRLLERIRPDVTNVSKFSPRPLTKAKLMEQLPNGVVKRRSVECSTLVRRISAGRKQAFIGRTLRVLVTERQRDYTGRDINYRQVVVKRFKGKLGDIVDVKITAANHGSLFGELAGEAAAGGR
jgi:MiaB-like tRNA modifying enzyme